jgi:uncharacterized protein (TIGR02145 family)
MKITFVKSTALLLFVFLSVGSIAVHGQTLKDKNGNVYKTIKFGLQEWTAGNLNVTCFRNGDVIFQAKTNEEWTNAGKDHKPAWCYSKNDPENGKKYGILYNWYAINDKRGLAPDGWRIPTNNDWMTLIKNLLGVDYAGPKLKNSSGWKARNGINKIGFSAIPGGLRNENGDFIFLGKVAQWWSNSEPVEVTKSNLIFSIKLNDNSTEVSYVKMKKENGLSVRCVRSLI